ncbi:alpha-D-ribose 1-methylphosphonate 5-phosphate C-P-lyase PhnJ [Vaginisenegalia massiliensis]|uniref:alpha-D-ribose 1-methylphosphonate 5-phosphate C-P-lyase PhnJ n=1 Tax=Vaginisenegalia massiliensis TaxID=2058294 RepID=UPI000F52A23A|nr:alpha-D-ribose 1-methylphosphonate 5-phosphate C-P-lyase PhnJ [Vaginisenegalia massiliensis]
MAYQQNFAFLDEGSKKEIRRAVLKALAIPGYQVPFASRELPIARGWGTGGLQLSLSLVGPHDVVKVIDQGSDESVNAVNIRQFITSSTGVEETIDTREATLIQSRHRVPEVPLRKGQILVLQVPLPEPLRSVEPSERVAKELHGDKDYAIGWLNLFEQIMRYETASLNADHPVMVNDRYLMAPSPIPRFDNPKLNHNDGILLFGAGREKKIYAIPPYTTVKSIDFDDYPFQTEDFSQVACRLSGRQDVFLDELVDEETGQTYYQMNDQSYLLQVLNEKEGTRDDFN